MEISKEKLGMNVRKGREKRGLSVEEVARRLGESAECVMKIEAGKKHVTLPMALSICAVLEMTPNELLDGVRS